MPEIGVQTDDDRSLALMECRVQSLTLCLQRGLAHRNNAPQNGLNFVINKRFCEDIYFHHFPSGYVFSNEEWQQVQNTAHRLLRDKVYDNYEVSDEMEIKHKVRDITLSALGFPIHIVELEYTEGLLLRNIVKHYDIRIPLDGRKATDLCIEEVGDELFDKYLYNVVGYEDRDGLRFRPLETRADEFRDFSGVPLQGLNQRKLETYLHRNLLDANVEEFNYEDDIIDLDTGLPYTVLQMDYVPPDFDEDDEEDEEED